MTTTLRNLLLIALVPTALACSGDGGADQQELWQSIVSELLVVVFALATPVLLVLLRKLAEVVREKWGMDISAAQEELVMTVVRQGLAYAEEQSRKALKEGKEPKTGDEKKIEAVKFISEKLETLGVLTWSSEKLSELVESALHMKREDPNDPTELELPDSAES